MTRPSTIRQPFPDPTAPAHRPAPAPDASGTNATGAAVRTDPAATALHRTVQQPGSPTDPGGPHAASTGARTDPATAALHRTLQQSAASGDPGGTISAPAPAVTTAAAADRSAALQRVVGQPGGPTGAGGDPVGAPFADTDLRVVLPKPAGPGSTALRGAGLGGRAGRPGRTVGPGSEPARRRIRRNPQAGALLLADCAAGLIGLCAVGPAGGAVLPVVLLGVLLAVHRKTGLYRPRLIPAVLDDVPAVALGAVLAWGLAAAALAATEPRDALGWSQLGSAAALSAFAALAGRALVHRVDRERSRREPAATLVVGAADAARRIADALRDHPEYGLRPIGIASPPPHRPGPGGDTLPFLSAHADIATAVSRGRIRHAVVVGPPAGPLAELLAAQGCRVWRTGGAEPPHLWGHGYAPFEGAPHARNRRGKRAMDIVLAGSALLGLAPVLGACALAVRLADGPGVLFRQERIGVGGRPFTLLKFRTLRPRDAHESATRWSVAHDHRMSAVGRVMRRTSLDELPQLWNVLCGDMSLVGPRPERPYFVEQFSTLHPGYQDRHRMPAGLTGLAQVHGLRGDTSIADRARFDNHYIDTWSLWQDVAIMLRTVRSLFRSGGS